MDRTRERAKAIRAATPDLLAELFEMQNRICDLCGQPIQDLVCAALDHSVPVIHFVRGPLPIDKAIRQANDPENLRAAHSLCNLKKNNKTRKEWFALGLDKKVRTQRVLTDSELLELQIRLGASGRKGGRKCKENGTGIFAPGIQAKGGRKNFENSTGMFTPENLSKNGRKGGRKGGRKCKENGTGIFAPEQRGAGGRAAYENGTGIFAPGISIKGGRKTKENGTGIFGMTAEEKAAAGRKAVHKRWHFDRGIHNPNCILCRATLGVVSC